MTHDINSAADAITMTALSLLPPRQIKNDDITRWWLALCDATARNVAVQVILAEPNIAHPATLRNATAADALATIGVQVALIPTTRLLHAKTAVIDNLVAWVGSGNFTAAAAHHNRELYLRVKNEITAIEVRGWQMQQARDAVTR
jgi:phosphatidylserine/phosphatidylglycerophosphate/cardiolipin synthase-like enzyme